MLTRGAVYVAYGKPARTEAQSSISSLLKHNKLPVAIISDEPLGDYQHLYAPDKDRGARWAKLNLNLLTPYSHTLYLDADVSVKANLDAGFKVLEDGWDICITPSANQVDAGNDGWLWHCKPEDREDVVKAWGFFPLVLQGGVFFLADNDRTRKLFESWREMWKVHREMDQGALLRALRENAVRIWLMGAPYNSQKGSVVSHRFGAARRRE